MNDYFLYENLDKNKLSEEDEKRIKYLRIPQIATLYKK